MSIKHYTNDTVKNLIGKRIVLGISGSIAAYKAIDLIQYLKDQGSKVKVVMTKSAKKFITPLTLQTISSYPILENLFAFQIHDTMPHIKLAKWADLIILAPTTANLLTKLSIGLADDLLCSLCLATTAPIVIAPAMNKQMYEAITTQSHLKLLRKRGFLIWGPEYGQQACKDIGFGRMTDPKILTQYIIHYFSKKNSLKNLNIMITAGPTHESLDPIRFFTNHSSGKMGFSIAQAAANKGANVTLIAGPVYLPTPNQVHRINVTTAVEMQTAVMKNIKNQQIFIGCAAVSDYRSVQYSIEKIKKNKDILKITMTKNPDIISKVGSLTHNRPYVVGFAAETQNLQENAQKKLIKKHLDLICANNIKYLNQGFNSNYNKLYLFWHNKSSILSWNTKTILAQQLITHIITHYNEKNKTQNY